jgi:hypothetical protein
MAKRKASTVSPPAPPDVKGMRAAQKAAQVQTGHMQNEQDALAWDGQDGSMTDGATVAQLRSHLHAALDLLDELE